MESVVRRVARFRQRFTRAIDLGSTATDRTQGPLINNNNPIVNAVSGDGNIVTNSNHIANYLVTADDQKSAVS